MPNGCKTGADSRARGITIWGPAEFQAELEALMPKIGNYEWIWSLLRWHARRAGYVSPKLLSVAKRFMKTDKPYFVGATSEGIKFVGDWRDDYAVTSVVLRNYDQALIACLKTQVDWTRGSYLDVGANLGITAATMAKYSAGRQVVVAFEPILETARRAAATFALNGPTLVQLVLGAVGDADGEITFYDSPGNSDSASAHMSDLGPMVKWQQTTVPCFTLDRLRRDGIIGRVGLLKLDVEGHEPQVLEGARSVIASDHPHVLAEYNARIAPQLGWSIEDLARAIERDAPYEFRVIHSDGRRDAFPSKICDREIVNVIAVPLAIG